jgi:hypothetical protein
MILKYDGVIAKLRQAQESTPAESADKADSREPER